MGKMVNWHLLLMLPFVLILNSCFQSTPEAPQQAVADTVAQLSLAGTAWQVESFGGPADLVPVLPETRPTVNYTAERYAGSGGCNWYLGVYETDGSSLRMQTPSVTRLICDSTEVMEQEGLFMSSLLNVTEYKMAGEKLEAYTVENQRLLTLVPSQPAPFEGTTWNLKLIFYDQRWRPVIPYSTITAQFKGEQISGSSGCNTYTATTAGEGERLMISNVTATEKACADPEGVMDQETAYLSVLSSITEYQAAGHALALLNGNGEAVLMFGAE